MMITWAELVGMHRRALRLKLANSTTWGRLAHRAPSMIKRLFNYAAVRVQQQVATETLRVSAVGLGVLTIPVVLLSGCEPVPGRSAFSGEPTPVESQLTALPVILPIPSPSPIVLPMTTQPSATPGGRVQSVSGASASPGPTSGRTLTVTSPPIPMTSEAAVPTASQAPPTPESAAVPAPSPGTVVAVTQTALTAVDRSIPTYQPPDSNMPANEVSALRRFGLDIVNDSRRSLGLTALVLGDSVAAQLDAEWSLANLDLMNYDIVGRPIEMSYTEFGGRGYVERRSYIFGYFDRQSIARCATPLVICERVEPQDALTDYLEAGLREGGAAGAEGLLAPSTQTLHLGVAFTDLTLVITEYVESGSIEYLQEPRITSGYLSFKLGHQGEESLRSIQMFHYPSPGTPADRLNRRKLMAIFRPPESGRVVTLPDEISAVADHWSNQDGSIDIAVAVDRHLQEPGVYELLLWYGPDVPAGQYYLEVYDSDELVLDPTNQPFALPEAPTLESLRQFALQLINIDRQDHGVTAVQLGSNGAAQLHAEDALAHGYLVGHWTSEGLKPYMIYRLTGGVGVVAENAAASGPEASRCSELRTVCGPVDHAAVIRELEWGMMYDDAHADWGHRDTIVDPNYDTVNIGIGFDDHRLTLYQHFEYNGVVYHPAPSLDDGVLRLTARPRSGHEIRHVAVYYDPSPRPRSNSEIEELTAYCTGGGFTDQCHGVRPVARVLRPPSGNQYYVHLGREDVVAEVWEGGTGGSVRIEADLGRLTQRGGVYTVVLVADGLDGELRRLSEYSIFR